jgi:hypothetical protein
LYSFAQAFVCSQEMFSGRSLAVYKRVLKDEQLKKRKRKL